MAKPKTKKDDEVKCGRCGTKIKKSDLAWLNQTGDAHLHVMEVGPVNPGEVTIYFHGLNEKGGSCHRAAIHLREIRSDKAASLAEEKAAEA